MKYLVTLYGTKNRCKEFWEVEATSPEDAEQKAERSQGNYLDEESGDWEDFDILSVEEQ